MSDETKFPKVLSAKEREDYGGNFQKDCVFTHPEAIVSLGKYGALDRNKSYLEAACGIGNLASVLHRNEYDVTASDKLDWGYGEVRPIESYKSNTYDVVITNPPYSLWEMFLKRSLHIARTDVYLLLPLRYLEGQHRSRILYTTHLSRVLIFSYRVKMYSPDGHQLSGMTAYAFFHWDLNSNSKHPEIHWLYR